MKYKEQKEYMEMLEENGWNTSFNRNSALLKEEIFFKYQESWKIGRKGKKKLEGQSKESNEF